MNKGIYNGLRAAINGFRETIIFERSFQIMTVVALAVLLGMFYFPTSKLEKIVLLFVIFSVLILELINSAIERIMDVVTSDHDERVRVIKDLMAAIVLLASLGAVVIGFAIFSPYVIRLL